MVPLCFGLKGLGNEDSMVVRHDTMALQVSVENEVVSY